MDRHGVRYLFEHRLLPKYFFEDGAKFIGILLDNDEILYDIINDIFEKEEVENPYSKEEFTVEAARLVEDILLLKICFPEPEEEPLCYCSYMLFDEKFEKKGYFCIEKGNEAGEYLPFVCGWTPDGSHLNYGNCGLKEEEGLFRCLEIYVEEIYRNNE